MERSTKDKNINTYTILSKYYDELLQDEEAYSYWLKYIEEKPFNNVLELASGSAVLTGILQRKGYNIIGSDISKDMAIAAKANYDGEYLIVNMTNYSLDRKFDLILCCCDSVNYLDEDELDNFIFCAYKHLNNHGRLIFDMHDIKRIEEFKEEYIEEGELSDCQYQWSISSDIFDNTLNEHFTFYTKDGVISEHHCQQVFETKSVKNKMKKYFKTRVINDFIPDEKILFIGEKNEEMV